jgi:predicted DNA-binding protein YlxM (UPF0122 family)
MDVQLAVPTSRHGLTLKQYYQDDGYCLREIANVFRVSREAMKYTLWDLRLLDKEKSRDWK